MSEKSAYDSLTPKQRRFVDVAMIEKLGALRQMAKHIGLIAPCSALAIKQEEIERRFSQYGAEFVLACFERVLDDGAGPIEKSAAATLIECFVPDWKERFPHAAGFVAERDDSEVRKWRTRVLERDGRVCSRCGSKDELHAHHIARWADHPMLRIVEENGVTLCRSCHVEEHHGKRT